MAYELFRRKNEKFLFSSSSFRTSIGYESFIRSTCGTLLYLMKENFDSITRNYRSTKPEFVFIEQFSSLFDCLDPIENYLSIPVMIQH